MLPVCLQAPPRIPLQSHLLPQRHAGGTVKLLLRVQAPGGSPAGGQARPFWLRRSGGGLPVLQVRGSSGCPDLSRRSSSIPSLHVGFLLPEWFSLDPDFSVGILLMEILLRSLAEALFCTSKINFFLHYTFRCIIAMGLDKKPTPPPKRTKGDSETDGFMAASSDMVRDEDEIRSSRSCECGNIPTDREQRDDQSESRWGGAKDGNVPIGLCAALRPLYLHLSKEHLPFHVTKITRRTLKARKRGQRSKSQDLITTVMARRGVWRTQVLETAHTLTARLRKTTPVSQHHPLHWVGVSSPWEEGENSMVILEPCIQEAGQLEGNTQ